MALTPIKSVSEVKAWLGLTAPTAQQSLWVDMVVKGQMGCFVQKLGYNPMSGTYTEYLPDVSDLGSRDQLVDSFEATGSPTRVSPVARHTSAQRVLQLANLPVRSVTSVYENSGAWDTAGGDWPAATLLGPSEYFIDFTAPTYGWSGLLIRNSGAWDRSPRSIKVTYTSGLTPAEMCEQMPEIEMAFFMACQIAYNAVKMHMGSGLAGGTGVVTAESLDSWSASYDAATNARLYGLLGTLPAAVAKMLGQYVNYGTYL